MTIAVEIPDSVASQLKARKGDLSRCALESLALEGYRSGELSTYQVRVMLGHDSRWQTEQFLRDHNAWQNPTIEDLDHDRETLKRVLS